MTKKILLLTFLGLFMLPYTASATVEPESKLIKQNYSPSVPVSRYKYTFKANSKGQATIDYEYKTDEGQTLKRQYQVYLPTKYHDRARYPLVVLLHGSERTGVSITQKWIPLAEKIGIVLVAPSHPKREWPLTLEETDIIEGIVNEVKEKISVHPLRTYIFGTSSGGDLALYMTIFKPDLFAAIAVHDAYFKDVKDYLRSDEPYHKTPIAFLNGTNDRRAPIDNVRDSAEFFARQGHDTILIEFIGHNDWYYTIASEINSKAMQFMGLFKTE